MRKTYPRKIPRIRCVVVGDGGVGKSCFLITVATDVFPANHVPIVFDNSVTDVQLLDGREAEVAFWDTVGAKEYDAMRPLTYPETDVLLMCFAVNSYNSFKNVRYKWICEIASYCSDTPRLLVGMKSDLRSNDGEGRPVHSMVEKDEAVQLAKDLGAVGYYECSSLLAIGLGDIIQAAVSAGLDYSIERRRRKFTWPWKSSKIAPLPSKPPEIVIPSSTLQSEWEKMINNEHLSDVQFHYNTDCYHGHKVVLCAASELFRRIFEIGRGLEAEESSLLCNSWSKKRLKAINRQCINTGAIEAFKSIYDKDNVSVITVNAEQVSKLAFERCLAFLYTGCADVKNDNDDIEDTIAAAKLLNSPELIVVCNNVKSDEEFLNSGLEKQLNHGNSEIMRKLFLNNALYSDITFVVDGRKIPAHRCVLTTRCEVMSAMFSGQFAESNTAEVEIPGVGFKTFMAFLEYLYTDYCSMDGDAMAILILANQYGINRLKALCELHISKMVGKATKENEPVTDFSVIDLLLTAQLHNADQLSGFLLHYVANHFQAFEKTEEFQKLTGENLSYVKEHRWPPLSFIDAMEENSNKRNCILM